MATAPTIGVAIPAYQAEPWIAETLETVLAQTSPPDALIVIDDGSTDGTADVVRGFGDAVRLLQQPNSGVPVTYNRAFSELTTDFVATCPADDLWEPRKLEWQRETLAARPEVDVTFGRARNFGLDEEEFLPPSGSGVLDRREFFREMYVEDRIAAPTAVIRRELFERLGGYREEIRVEDYDFWFRALVSGATFFYDPRLLVRLRRHGGNLSAQALLIWELNYLIHSTYAADLGDEALTRKVLAHDLQNIGRCRLGLGDAAAARKAYRLALAQQPRPADYALSAGLRLPGAGALFRLIAGRRKAG